MAIGKMSQEEYDDAMARVTAKAWASKQYKNRLLTEPAAVFAEEGVKLGKRNIQVHQNTKSDFHFVLCKKPSGPQPEAKPSKIRPFYTIHEVEI